MTFILTVSKRAAWAVNTRGCPRCGEPRIRHRDGRKCGETPTQYAEALDAAIHRVHAEDARSSVLVPDGR